MEKNLPLVTISIPTFNSEKFIDLCLEAIKKQTYKNIEVNVIDGDSKDRTVDIVRKYGFNISICKKALLGARDEGVKIANGDFTLLLDSDQILEKTAIERAVNKMNEGFDMLVLKEDVYRNKNFIEHLFQADRDLVHAVKDFNPMTSVMLPRFYRTGLLKKVFKIIPEDVKIEVGGQDHAIIYFEAYRFSKKVDLLSNAVKHIEPNSLMAIWKKFYRWGYTSVGARKNKYTRLVDKKERFRKGLFGKGLFSRSIMSILLLILKGIPYKIGYSWAKYISRIIKKIKFFTSANFISRYYIGKCLFFIIKKYKFSGKLIDIGCGNKPYKDLFQGVSLYEGIDFRKFSRNNFFNLACPDYYFSSKYFKDLRLDFKDESYDIAVSFQVLEHHKNPEKLIDEMFRITKRGGYLLFSFPLINEIHEAPNDYFRFTEYGFKELIKNFKYEILEVKKEGKLFSIFYKLAIANLINFSSRSKVNYLFALLVCPIFLVFQYIAIIMDKLIRNDNVFINYVILVRKN